MPTVIRRSGVSSISPTDRRRDIFHAVSWQVQVRSSIWSPPTDIYETDDAYIIRVEVAGMREEGFQVIVENDYLIISGIRPDVSERRAYHQMEIRFGKFSAMVGLPGPVNLDQAEAAYENGFLTVTLPKAKPSQIHIQDEG
jgi:HSP20 family protein